MGESAAQTVREIEQVRDRLDGEVRELEERLPPVHVAKKVAGTLMVGGTGTVFWWAVRRARGRKNKKRKAESRTVDAVVQIVPERWAKDVAQALNDGRWQRPAAYAAGAWAIFKVAEVRQLRRMNKLLATRG
ncbi:MAG: hypothetical protein WEB06_17500 [Actinomycetota bacterium]